MRTEKQLEVRQAEKRRLSNVRRVAAKPRRMTQTSTNYDKAVGKGTKQGERRLIVFISSPLRDKEPKVVYRNIDNAEEYCRMCYERGHMPLAPHVYLTSFLIAGDKKADAFAAEFSEFWIARSNVFWCFDKGGISKGMAAELEYAKKCGIPIRYDSKGEI